MLGNFTASTNRLSTTICPFLNSHNVIQQRTEKKTFSLGRLDVSLSVSGYEIFAHIVCNMILAWQRTINNFRLKITLQLLLFIACRECKVCVMLSLLMMKIKVKACTLVPLTHLINTKSVFKIHNYV